jgi:tetratricopeptide (TPR) repeat protein
MRIDDLPRCVFRITTESGRGLGTGCLVSDEGHVLTVCHLFQDWPTPEERKPLNFKAVYSPRVKTDDITEWSLCLLEETFDAETDIAVCQLELNGDPLPDEMCIAELADLSPYGHYKAFGFGQRDNFLQSWSSGELLGEIRRDDNTDWLQLTRDQIVPGLSGAPILKLEHGGDSGRVIGVVRGRGKDPGDDFAYGVPLKNIKRLFPDIRTFHPHLSYRFSRYYLLPEIGTDHFTGREKELGWLKRQIVDEEKRLVGIVGEPGIGKSTLAKRFAELYSDYFPEGAIGQSVQDKDTKAIARSYLVLVGNEDPPDKPATTLWNEQFSERQMLLILDNAEERRIVNLKPEPVDSTVLVTSRDHSIVNDLGVSQEAVLDLSQTTFQFTSEDALALMCSLFGDEADLVDTQLEDAKEILAMVGHLPLAVRVIVSLMRRMPMPFAEFAASLREFRERNELVGTLGLRDVFRYSLEALQAKSGRWVNLFLSLGACVASGFTNEIAAVVSGETPTSIKFGLYELVSLSLVRGSPDDRMSFHPFVREFAREEANRRGILEIAEERYSRHFVELVIRAGPDSIDVGINEKEVEPLTPAELEQQMDAILFATNWLLTREDPRLNQAFWRGLRPVFETRDFTEEAVQLVKEFVQIADERGNLELRAYFYRQLGKAHYQANQLKAAFEATRFGLDLERRRGDEGLSEQGKALTLIGRSLTRQKRLEEALEAHREALEIAERSGEGESLVIALSTLGLALSRHKQHKEAIQHLSRAWQIAEGIDADKRVICLSQFMKVLMAAERYDEAIKHGERALVLIRRYRVDSPRSKTTVLRSLSRAYKKRSTHGDKYRAAELLEQAIEVEHESRRPKRHRLASFLLDLIRLMFDLRKKREALPYCRELLALNEERNEWNLIANALEYLGESLLRSNRPQEALIHLQRCLELREAYRPAWDYRLQELEIKELYNFALWNTGRRLEAIRGHWDLVKGFQVRGQPRDEFHARWALGRLAHWLYRYGRQALYDEDTEAVRLVDTYFRWVRAEDENNRYVLYELARYMEEKARYTPAISSHGIEIGIQYLLGARNLYLSVLQQAKSKVQELEEILERKRMKSTSAYRLGFRIEREKELVAKSRDAVERTTELKRNFEKAEDYVEELNQVRWEIQQCREFARHLRFGLRQPRAAKSILEQIVEEDNEGRAILDLAQICRSLGETDAADAYFRLALRKRPKFRYHRDYADFLASDKKDVEKAAEYYQRAGKVMQHSSTIPCRLGILYWKHSYQPERARGFFEKALHLSKGDDYPGNREEVVSNSLEFFANHGECERVEEIISSLEPVLKQRPSVMIAIADARYQCGHTSVEYVYDLYERALDIAKKAVEKAEERTKRRMKGKCAYTCWRYANFLQANNQAQNAGEYYQQAHELADRTKADFLASYMLLEFHWGRRRMAERLLEELQRLDIRHPAVAEGEALLDESGEDEDSDEDE